MPTLIMDLTLEQGAGRETQVQPTKGAWARFFDLDFDAPQVLTLHDPAGNLQLRAVVLHDHNWTVEIPEAHPPRPAIIRFDQIGQDEYNYYVYRPGSVDFGHLDWMLSNIPNPYQRHGRRWLIV